MIQLGNHMWDTCCECGKLVKLTGWLRGIHLCLTPEEIAWKRQAQQRQQTRAALVEDLFGKGRAER